MPLTSRPLPSEGAGNAGRLARPQPRVVVENTRVSHHGHTGNTRHSPRNGFTAYIALSPVTGFLATVPARCKASSPVDASVGTSGPHDFAVRDSAIRQERHPRPPHPRPTSRDDRDTPLLWARTGGACRDDLPVGESGKSLPEPLDSAGKSREPHGHPPKSSGCLLRVVTASRRHIESGKEKASQWVENRILLKPCVASSLTVVFDRNVRQQDASQGENQMKIQTVSVVLMSLVSGLAFTSPAMAAGAPRCPPGHISVGGRCLPEALVPMDTATGIDTSSCSITQATSTVHCSSISMPTKTFEKLIKNQPPSRVVN